MSNEPATLAPADELAQLRLLAEAARAVHASLDLREKLEWATQAARELAGATFAAYVSAPDEGSRVEAVARQPAPRLGAVSKDKGLPGWAVGDVIDPLVVELGPVAPRRSTPGALGSWLTVPVRSSDGR